MGTTCLSYPVNEPIVILRDSLVRVCEGNHCAAALVNYFAYWHTVRKGNVEQARHLNRVAMAHGEQGQNDTSLLVYKNEATIEKEMLSLYGRRTIRKAMGYLVARDFVSVHQNPNKRYRGDRTHYYLFHPDVVQDEIDAITQAAILPDEQNGHEVILPFEEQSAQEPDETTEIDAITQEAILPDEENGQAAILPDEENGHEVFLPFANGNFAACKDLEITSKEKKEEKPPLCISPPEGENPHQGKNGVISLEKISTDGKRPRRRNQEPHRCPADYQPSPGLREWLTTQHPLLDCDAELMAMKDHEFRRAIRDWDAATRNWFRKAEEIRIERQEELEYRRSLYGQKSKSTKAAEIQQALLAWNDEVAL